MATEPENATHPVDATALIALLPTRPRLLALGEPTHGEDALLHLRNDVFRQLVQEQGYRTIALESCCLAGLTVDAHITSGEGTLDEAMEHGFTHGFGASAANRELVHWMRTHNEDRPPADQLRFAGFDGPLEITGAQSPRHALTALHTYLTTHPDTGPLPCTPETLDHLIGDDTRWTDPTAMTDPSRSPGQTPEADGLRLLADDLTTLLETLTPTTTTVREALDRAHLYARTATGLLRYHFWTADTSPRRMTRLLGLRAQMMAENLLALTTRGPVLAHAHNAHLQRPKSSMRMNGTPLHWWSAGALASTRLGQDYAFIATTLGTIRHRGVPTPPPNTLEGLLNTLPGDRHLIDAPRLAATLDPTPETRTSPWFGYAPFDPAHLADTDGIIHLKNIPQN